MENEFHQISKFPNYEITKCGKLRNRTTLKNKKIFDTGFGYLGCVLWVNNVPKNTYLHRLLAEQFIPNPFNLREVNHKDGNPKNNSLDNLEWCSSSQNRKHAYDTGLFKSRKGENQNRSKLKNEDIFEIRRRSSDGETNVSIAKYYGIAETTVSQIKRRKLWSHI